MSSLINRMGKGFFCMPLGNFGRPVLAAIIFVYEKSVMAILLSVYGKSRTIFPMTNVLSTEKKASVISMLTEGRSIRSVERVTGVHRDTVMRLGIQVGTACERLMRETMRDLP